MDLKMKVLVTATNYTRYCSKGKKILTDAGLEVVENPHQRPYTSSELCRIISDIDAVVAGVDRWDEQIFSRASRLKVIARFGVGVDNIDLEAAKQYGIAVCNTPGVNSSAVAEQTAAFMLSLLRRIPELNQAVREGSWTRPMFHELKTRTVGFLGFGRIARCTAEMLRGFHPKMIAYDRYPDYAVSEKLGVKLVSADTLFRTADIISIHLPALEETKHFIRAETIRQMKTGVYIVNTARGSIVNEEDLAEALRSKKIAGYGTDVFEEEPVKKENPLFGFENCIAAPHVSAETYENCEMTSIVTAEAVLSALSKKEPENRIV